MLRMCFRRSCGSDYVLEISHSCSRLLPVASPEIVHRASGVTEGSFALERNQSGPTERCVVGVEAVGGAHDDTCSLHHLCLEFDPSTFGHPSAERGRGEARRSEARLDEARRGRKRKKKKKKMRKNQNNSILYRPDYDV